MAIDKKHPDYNLDGLVELSMHGNTYVIPCDDAIEIFKRMQKAVELDYSYEESVKKYYVRKPKAYIIHIRMLDQDAYIEGLINGAKP